MGNIRMQNMIAIVVAVALLIAMLPTVVLAAGNGSINGQFTLGDAAPTVDSVVLYNETGNVTVTTMTPETIYVIKVTVTDTNTLNDVDFVKATLYYDGDGNQANDNVSALSASPQNCAIMTAYRTDNWTTDNWTLNTGGLTRWTATDFVQPTTTGSSGTFEFKFEVGAVATMTDATSRWHIHAEANDGSSATSVQTNREMAWYGELTVSVSPSLTWSGIAPGGGFTSQTTGTITENYVSNGAWVIKVAATSPWTSAGGNATLVTDNTTLGASQFALKANDTAEVATAEYVKQYTTYSSAIQSGTQTTEAGDTSATNTLWLSLGSPFPNGTYSGSIYYKISNS